MKHERLSGHRNVRQEVVSKQGKSSLWFLRGGDSTKFQLQLKEFAEFAAEMKRFKVADLTALLNLDIAFEDFVPSTGGKSSSQLFSTIGYKTIERVLKNGDTLTVLGEITATRQIKTDEHPVYVLSKPSTSGLLDLKVTTFIYIEIHS